MGDEEPVRETANAVIRELLRSGLSHADAAEKFLARKDAVQLIRPFVYDAVRNIDRTMARETEGQMALEQMRARQIAAPAPAAGAKTRGRQGQRHAAAWRPADEDLTEWRKLRGVKFWTPNGYRYWDTATELDHQARIESQQKLMSGCVKDVQRHQMAIDHIRRAGVASLSALLAAADKAA